MRTELRFLGTIKCRLNSTKLEEQLYAHEYRSGEYRKTLFFLGEDETQTGLVVDRQSGDDYNIGDIRYEVSFILRHEDRGKDISIFFKMWGGFDKPICISGFPRKLYNEAKGESHYQHCS